MRTQNGNELCSHINQDTASTSNPMNQADVDRSLLVFVKQNTTIWDKNCNTYPNKHLKSQLWDSIATSLNLKTNACMLRWKALREKYIQHEGEKWELLDELSFLDKVIQYRKKVMIHDQKTNSGNFQNNLSPSMTTHEATPHFRERENNFPQNPFTYETGDESSLNESSNDFGVNVKEESTAIEVADSSCYSNTSRKRLSSTNSEAASEKREKTGDTVQNCKSPEDLFGDLVAAILNRKPENDRNRYMIEIMIVLSK